jgi:hypothetical protein
MFSFLSPRLLIFYITSIGVVLTLFSVTTTYGETKLKAQKPVNGQYAIAKSDLPPCLRSNLSDPAVLAIQQSGRYVTAALLSTQASAQQRKTAEQRPNWSGRWQDRHLTLTGQVNGCPASIQVDGQLQPEPLSGSFAIQGTVQMGSQTWPLRAKRLPAETPAPAH